MKKMGLKILRFAQRGVAVLLIKDWVTCIFYVCGINRVDIENDAPRPGRYAYV